MKDPSGNNNYSQNYKSKYDIVSSNYESGNNKKNYIPYTR